MMGRHVCCRSGHTPDHGCCDHPAVRFLHTHQSPHEEATTQAATTSPTIAQELDVTCGACDGAGFALDAVGVYQACPRCAGGGVDPVVVAATSGNTLTVVRFAG